MFLIVENFINRWQDFKLVSTFIMDKKYQVGKLEKIILAVDSNIRSVNIFDVFEGENLPQDKKSVAISVSMQAQDKTLSDSDLNQISQKIIKEVENKTGGKIRT